MKNTLIDLVNCNAIIAGKLIKENDIVRFERVSKEELSEIPEKERAYATTSMGRAIFTVDEQGKVHNFKGVDSHLQMNELGPVELTNARTIEYTNIDNPASYKISAVVFNNKKPEIRINGTAPLEDIEIEGDINKKLSDMGIKVPQIIYIRELPQEYSLKYGLPIKVKGSLEEFSSSYAEEDDKRKARLKNIFGENYVQELENTQRPESMKEFLERVGFLNSDQIKEAVATLGYSMEIFVDAVDKSYSRGQRYGQAERLLDSPFRISDIEIYVKNNDIESLLAIFDFTEKNNEDFAKDLAKSFGKNIAILLNNGWECENLIHRQDFSLTGEFCDDAYFDILEEQELLKRDYKDEPHKIDALINENKRRYTGQVMHIASCIKVVQDAMRLVGKDDKEIDSVLDSYVESFTENLDFKAIGNVLQKDEKAALKVLEKEFSATQNWVEKMAGQDRREGFVMDDAIYNSHIGNEEYYSKVAKMITERIRSKENRKETKPINELFSEVLEEMKDVELLDKIKGTQSAQKMEIEEKKDISKI